MATYEQAFNIMLKTARKMYDTKEGYTADKWLYRLFGQAEMCKELFGVSALQTLHRIERELDE